MGVARLKHGTLKTVTLNDRRGEVIERYEAGIITDHRASTIHLPRQPLPEPTISQMLTNFAGAMGEWLAAGMPVASRETAIARIIACRSCPGNHWREDARGGLGKCSHPKCGCTKGKMWLGTSRCPIGHWPA